MTIIMLESVHEIADDVTAQTRNWEDHYGFKAKNADPQKIVYHNQHLINKIVN